jgi:hypothetical protein
MANKYFFETFFHSQRTPAPSLNPQWAGPRFLYGQSLKRASLPLHSMWSYENLSGTEPKWDPWNSSSDSEKPSCLQTTSAWKRNNISLDFWDSELNNWVKYSRPKVFTSLVRYPGGRVRVRKYLRQGRGPQILWKFFVKSLGVSKIFRMTWHFIWVSE